MCNLTFQFRKLKIVSHAVHASKQIIIQPVQSTKHPPLIICHIYLVTRGRASTFGRWETSVAKQDWASNQEGEEGAGGGKVGPAGGPFPRRLALCCSASHQEEVGEQVIAPTLEGLPGKGSSLEPTVPAIHPASSQPAPSMHTHPPTSQFAVGTAYQPVCFLFPRIRTCEYERGHHSLTLFVPAVSVFCQSA